MLGRLAVLLHQRPSARQIVDSGGWGYAAFDYNAATGKFSPGTEDSTPPQEHDAQCGYACHTIVENSGYLFTEYGKRSGST